MVAHGPGLGDWIRWATDFQCGLLPHAFTYLNGLFRLVEIEFPDVAFVYVNAHFARQPFGVRPY